MQLAAHKLREPPALQLHQPLAGRRRPPLVTFKRLVFPVPGRTPSGEMGLIKCVATKQVVDAHLAQASPLVHGVWEMFVHCKFVIRPVDQPGITWQELLLFATAWTADDTNAE